MAGSGFEVDLMEMESALRTVDGLISDNFGAGGGSSGWDGAAGQSPQPLSRLPFQNGAASDIQQTDSAEQLRCGTEAQGESATFYGLDFQEAATLDDAHGTLLDSLLALRTSIEQGIETLRRNLQATHQTYSATEENINLRVAGVAPMAIA